MWETNKQAARRRWLERGLSWASWCRGNYPRKRERTCSWDGELGWIQGTGGSSWRTDSGLITKTWVMSERVPPSLVSSMDSSTWTWLPLTCSASTLLSDHLVPRNLVFGNAAFCPSPFCNLVVVCKAHYKEMFSNEITIFFYIVPVDLSRLSPISEFEGSASD